MTFFVIFAALSLNRFWQYSVWYYDFGIFFQAISSVSRLEPPIIDHFYYSGKNILGDHFHPLIFIISPVYAIFKYAEVLLIVQTLFVTLSGVVMYLVTKHLTKNKLESFFLLVIYLSFIGLHNALITEFHELTLLPLPLSIFFLGMVKKNWKLYLIGLITVLMAKETTFIIPAWFGLWIAIKNKGLWRNIGLATVFGSIAYGTLVLFYLIPTIGGQSYHYLSEASSNTEIGDYFTKVKRQTVFKTLLSYGFLPILAPETWPPILFNWWSRSKSIWTTRHDLGMHYNAEIAPTLFLGTILGWNRFKKFGWSTGQNWLQKYLFKKNPGNFWGGLVKKYKIRLKPHWLLAILAVFSLFLSLMVFKSPALMFFNKDFYRHTKNFVFLDKLMAEIPEEGIVMAQHNIAGKLAYRKVYILRNNYQDFNPDYIVIDTREGQEPNNFLGIDDWPELLETLRADSNYEVYYQQGEQFIYKKVGNY